MIADSIVYEVADNGIMLVVGEDFFLFKPRRGTGTKIFHRNDSGSRKVWSDINVYDALKKALKGGGNNAETM